MVGQERTGETPTGKALAMLSVFASVGARTFDLSITDINGQEVKGLQRPGRSLEAVRQMIDRVLQHSERHSHNVIIRPRSATATLIQLDDLDSAKVAAITPYAFLVICTSPGNHQAWVAIEKEVPSDFRRRLNKGTGEKEFADVSASGSTRIAGSLNFKEKYAPAFPRVEITHVKTGHMTTSAALEHGGFVAPREEPKTPRRRKIPFKTGTSKWPSYERCIQGAPPAQGDPTKPDISRADFTWCRTAYHWGHSVEDIAAQLSELSECARKDGPAYVQRTVSRAAASVDREKEPTKYSPRPA